MDAKLRQAIYDIWMQATRKDRGTEDKPYLITDLEIVARKARDILDAPDPETRYAERLVGFALFNLAKGKVQAVETLLGKAYESLSGERWDEENPEENYANKGINRNVVAAAQRAWDEFSEASRTCADAYDEWNYRKTLTSAIRRDDAAKRMNALHDGATCALAILEEAGVM